MAELDHIDLMSMYLLLRSIKCALVVAGVGDRIKHTSELKILNYKKAMQNPDVEEWCNEIRNEKV